MARRRSSCTVPRASIRRSMSSCVLWIAIDARVEARRAEAAHQRLRAVVAGAHADALAAEDLGHVVRVDALDREADQRAALVEVGGAVDRQALDLGEPLERVGRDLAAVLAHRVHARLGQPVDRGAEADRLGHRHRAGLELGRRLGPGGLEVADAGDHVPAAEERRHLLAAARGGRAGRRCRSGRRPCGRSRRRSRRRARRRRPAATARPGRRRPSPARRPRGPSRRSRRSG